MAKKRVLGRCRLCQNEDWLVDSHIIPNFHYKPLKKNEGAFYVMSTDPAQKVIKRQKGVTEPLLCAECDNVRLGRNEQHLSEVVFGGYPLDGKQHGRFLVISGYDYKKVKNGLLSILWRMSVSTNPYFSEVDLGKRHEEALRAVLFNNLELD